jgi:predicted nucleic acid-binding Zn ribbon protein
MKRRNAMNNIFYIIGVVVVVAVVLGYLGLR